MIFSFQRRGTSLKLKSNVIYAIPHPQLSLAELLNSVRCAAGCLCGFITRQRCDCCRASFVPLPLASTSVATCYAWSSTKLYVCRQQHFAIRHVSNKWFFLNAVSLCTREKEREEILWPYTACHHFLLLQLFFTWNHVAHRPSCGVDIDSLIGSGAAPCIDFPLALRTNTSLAYSETCWLHIMCCVCLHIQNDDIRSCIQKKATTKNASNQQPL